MYACKHRRIFLGLCLHKWEFIFIFVYSFTHLYINLLFCGFHFLFVVPVMISMYIHIYIYKYTHGNESSTNVCLILCTDGKLLDIVKNKLSLHQAAGAFDPIHLALDRRRER